MRQVILETPERRWSCPNCVVMHVTREPQAHTPFHTCAGLAGLTAPFVAEGTRCRVEAVERQDYDDPGAQRDANGRPVMAVVTTRDDGQDCAVLAPVGVAGAHASRVGG